MDSARRAPATGPAAEALEFVRFCYRRRRLGWPELYDEMCTVAGRGLFRGWGTDELAAVGIGLSLFEMPGLAAMSARVVAEEIAAEREGRGTGPGRGGRPAETDGGEVRTTAQPADARPDGEPRPVMLISPAVA